jgi:hypothetical protein
MVSTISRRAPGGDFRHREAHQAARGIGAHGEHGSIRIDVEPEQREVASFERHGHAAAALFGHGAQIAP